MWVWVRVCVCVFVCPSLWLEDSTGEMVSPSPCWFRSLTLAAVIGSKHFIHCAVSLAYLFIHGVCVHFGERAHGYHNTHVKVRWSVMMVSAFNPPSHLAGFSFECSQCSASKALSWPAHDTVFVLTYVHCMTVLTQFHLLVWQETQNPQWKNLTNLTPSRGTSVGKKKNRGRGDKSKKYLPYL